MLRYTLLRTVLNPLLAIAGDQGLMRLEFLPRGYKYHTHANAFAKSIARGDDACAGDLIEDPSAFEDLRSQLAEYFIGQRETFDVPLDLRGTPFQLNVWQRLRTIPYGKLKTYKEIAQAIKRPAAMRAVGQAAGHNPVPILVPCHRLIGTKRTLVGFAGGLSVKAQLLRLEGHTLGGTHHLEAAQLF
ncbi:methylated-DNA--[protein]-cysteine S-methyltransferase [bacterium]|nr:methylated-DNA--[protein]-cysteine S-methyltransferase [bacterium]MBU1676121.1 methylated-DNA--[protein]-cysteine S-methyltransferase [bacterium]